MAGRAEHLRATGDPGPHQQGPANVARRGAPARGKDKAAGKGRAAGGNKAAGKGGAESAKGRQGGGRGSGRAEREPVSQQVGGGLAELLPDRDRPGAWTLLIDGAPQSHVDLDDPAHLSFAYQRRLGHVIDLAAPPLQPLHVLHLGGGAFTLARYTAATRPRSTQQIVELDAPLVQLVRDHLPLDPQARVRVRATDAREGLGKFPDGWADLIIADVFSGARTPAHLTSAEFLAEVRRVLKPDGRYAANLADGPRSPICAARSPPPPPSSPNWRWPPTRWCGGAAASATRSCSPPPCRSRSRSSPGGWRATRTPAASNTAARSPTSPAARPSSPTPRPNRRPRRRRPSSRTPEQPLSST